MRNCRRVASRQLLYERLLRTVDLRRRWVAFVSPVTPIENQELHKGDVIIFTGTDAKQRIGGHVGIILENKNGNISFIHGSSGKANGVTISNLSEAYYTQRFLKIVRVL